MTSRMSSAALGVLLALAAALYLRVYSPNKNSSLGVDGSRSVRFVNNFDDDGGQRVLNLLWWNPEQRKEELKATLKPGESHVASTFVRDFWMFRDVSNGSVVRSTTITASSAAQVFARQSQLEFEQERASVPWHHVVPRCLVNTLPCRDDRVAHVQQRSSHFGLYHRADDVRHLVGKTHIFEVQTLSMQPRILHLADFLSHDECDHMMERAKELGGLKRSTATDAAAVLTSSNVWADVAASDVIEHIMKRIFNTIGGWYTREKARKITETFQFMYYSEAPEYKGHEDLFAVDENSAPNIEVLRGQTWLATFFLYLSDVGTNDETTFPKAKDHESADAFSDGFHVKPAKGDAVIFYSELDGNPFV